MALNKSWVRGQKRVTTSAVPVADTCGTVGEGSYRLHAATSTRMREDYEGPNVKTNRQFTISEMLLLVTFIGTWLAITAQLGSLSILFWGLTVVMAAILRPAHQRHQTPESVTDVLSVAVCWAVACGVAGFALDLRFPGNATADLFSWAVLGQLTGFYLGLVWVLVVLLARHVERVAGPASRTRPIA